MIFFVPFPFDSSLINHTVIDFQQLRDKRNFCWLFGTYMKMYAFRIYTDIQESALPRILPFRYF